MRVAGTKRRKGVALLMVLMAVLFCTMMLGAFLLNNRTYLQLHKRGDLQDQVQNDQRSLYEFARSNLEKNKGWGTPHPNPVLAPYIDGDLTWVEHEWDDSSDKTSVVTGELPDGLLFRLDILNNMRTDAVVEGVSPKSCRVKIALYEANREYDHTVLRENPENFVILGGATALLHNAAFFDSSIVASQAIQLYANNIKFHSKDPVRNQVRSNTAVLLPDVVPSAGDFSLDFAFLNAAGDVYNPRGYDGTVWAKGVIGLGDATLPGELEQATEDTNGQFIQNAETNYQIPELNPEDFRGGGGGVRTLTSGIYVFSDHWVQFGDDPGTRREVTILQQLSSLDDGALGNGTDGNRDIRFDKLYVDAAFLPSGADPNDIRLLVGNTPGGAAFPVPSKAIPAAGAELMDSDDGLPTGLTVDIDQRVMNVEAGVTLDAPGDVTIVAISEYTVVGDADAGIVNPNVLYAEQVKLNFGVADADSPDGRSCIRSDGSINVGGFVQGKGNLIASKDVLMGPNAVDLTSDTQTDLAVYAGRNVVIYPLVNTVAGATASFRGLIYAEQNFHFRNDSSLEVEGALVARQGHVYLIAGRADLEDGHLTNIQATENLKVTYNPEFLDSLLKPTTNERTKVELLAWRPNH